MVIVVEPWMSFSDFPTDWIRILRLKLFSTNSRDSLIPNILCFCNNHFNLSLIHVDRHVVAFPIIYESKVFGISAIYASTNYKIIRNMWNKLSEIYLGF